jgi:hypothetical protein
MSVSFCFIFQTLLSSLRHMDNSLLPGIGGIAMHIIIIERVHIPYRVKQHTMHCMYFKLD